jgi:hypothetical protein
MTLNSLHKLIGALIAQGHGRAAVAVDKQSYRDNRESDGCVILDVCGVTVYPVPMADDDGGTATNKDGSERFRTTCVLYGSCGLTDETKGNAPGSVL